MATVHDPNFWKRFSIAVHQDEMLKEEANRPGVKHTYVTTISLCDDNITMSSLSPPLPTPTSQSHILSPTAPKFALYPHTSPYPAPSSRPMTAGAAPTASHSSHPRSSSSHDRPRSYSHSRPFFQTRPPSSSSPESLLPPSQPSPPRHSSKPQTPAPPSTPPPEPALPSTSPQTTSTSTTHSPKATPTRLTKPPKTHAVPDTSGTPNIHGNSGRPRARSNPLLFNRQANTSQLTLGLSGRPQSRFKFWTSVSADPSHRNSWLESQKRKARHRTYICWGFWSTLIVVVAGVVAAVLVLKSKGVL